MKFKTTAEVYAEKGKALPDYMTKRKRGDSPIAKREKQRMRDILAGKDVESKEESMRKLSLHARWGA